jgi:transposase
MSSHLYPSDLPDREWHLSNPLSPPAEPGGRPRTRDRRLVLNALFAVVRDYEYLPQTSETMIYVAMIRLMLKRLGNAV